MEADTSLAAPDLSFFEDDRDLCATGGCARWTKESQSRTIARAEFVPPLVSESDPTPPNNAELEHPLRSPCTLQIVKVAIAARAAPWPTRHVEQQRQSRPCELTRSGSRRSNRFHDCKSSQSHCSTIVPSSRNTSLSASWLQISDSCRTKPAQNSTAGSISCSCHASACGSQWVPSSTHNWPSSIHLEGFHHS